jgi:ribosomal protein S18 acetylase RimI-like enzyme
MPRIREMFSVLTVDLLDLLVLSKPYFDRNGLILAFEENQIGEAATPVGFVHAGFGPNSALSDLDPEQGIVCQLKVLPSDRAEEISQGLLNAAVDYLKREGSKMIHIGSRFPHAPFYLGLYGGSRMPGVIQEDVLARNAFLNFGFRDVDEVYILERKMAGFRPPAGRNQMDIRRNYHVKAIPDPLESSWWECCLFSLAERDRFTLYSPKRREIAGCVSFWDMQPMSTERGTTCRGLYDLYIEPQYRRTGLATFLIGESLKGLAQRGVGQVEVQVLASDQASFQLFQKLGFEKKATAFQMSKSL